MIELTYRDLHNRTFVDGLRTLADTPGMSFTTSWKIARIQDKVVKESQTANTMWQKIMNTQIEWVGEGPEKKPKDPAKVKEFEEEFFNIKFDCGKWDKVHVQDVHMARGIKPNHLWALQPILDGLETLEDDKKPGLSVVEGGKDGENKKEKA